MRKVVTSVGAIALVALGLAWAVPQPASATAAASFVMDSPSFAECVKTATDACKYGIASFSYSDGKCSFSCILTPPPPPKPGAGGGGEAAIGH